MAETVLTEEIQPGIVLVTMNRPKSLNALSMSQVSAIKDCFAALGKDRSCRVIILTGAGRGFCAGADLKDDEVAPGAEGMTTLGYVYKSQQHLVEMLLTIRELEKPVIAAVNGTAVGGGLALSLACDIRYAGKSASFGSVFIKVGLSSCDVGVSYLLPRVVGASRAAELMLTGRIFAAEEAQAMGLVQDLVDDDKLIARAVETAQLIAQNNEYGVWQTKLGLWQNLDAPSLRHAMEIENRTQVLGYFAGNMEEATQAFREGRAPEWKDL